MTIGIGNEFDPGDPPEIHAERTKTKKPRRAEAKVIGQKTVRGYIAEINRLLRLPDTTLEQKIELLRQSERYQKLLVRRTPRKAKTPENASPWAS